MKRLLILSVFFIFAVTGAFSSELSRDVLDYYENEDYIKVIESLEPEQDLTPDLRFLLAESYLFSITGPASWMKYNNKYQDTITQCLENDPANVLYQINSARGMMWFPSARGGRDEGIELILNLEKKHPEHPEVIYAVSNYRSEEGFTEEAKNGYLKVLDIKPNHKKAKEQLDIILLNEKKLKIRNITFTGNRWISQKTLFEKISEFEGAILNGESRSGIREKLKEKPAINKVSVKATSVDDYYVDLEVEITEESSRILMFQQASGMGMDFDRDLVPSGLMPPVTIYIDNNFLGTGSKLMFITVFVYNQLQLTVPGLIDDKYLDFKLNLTSMLLSGKNSSYFDGEKTEGTKQNSYHIAKAGLGRTFPFNLSTFLYYQARFDVHTDLENNITPNHLITHSLSGEIIFNSAGSADTPFDLQEGLNFRFIPTVNYKQDYKPWGDPNNLTTHDDNVSMTFLTKMAYYRNLNSKNNLSLSGAWYMNHNPYESDRFSFGHRGDAITFDSLTGYLPGEISFDNGILLNLKHTVTPIVNKVNFYGKYDVVFDIKNREFYNGVALGGAVKLPWNLDLKGEFGVGLNAVRDSGPGLFLSLELSKLMIF